jgi:hypothetical protein
MNIEPGQYILWNGKIAHIVAITDQPTAVIRYVRDEDRDRCACGEVIERDIHMVIGCRIWEDSVQPVPTVKGRGA